MEKHLSFKPGSTPIQPGELPRQKSIEEIGTEVQAHDSVKNIKKILRRLPPIAHNIIEERDRRLGEKEG